MKEINIQLGFKSSKNRNLVTSHFANLSPLSGYFKVVIFLLLRPLPGPNFVSISYLILE